MDSAGTLITGYSKCRFGRAFVFLGTVKWISLVSGLSRFSSIEALQVYEVFRYNYHFLLVAGATLSGPAAEIKVRTRDLG